MQGTSLSLSLLRLAIDRSSLLAMRAAMASTTQLGLGSRLRLHSPIEVAASIEAGAAGVRFCTKTTLKCCSRGVVRCVGEGAVTAVENHDEIARLEQVSRIKF